MGLVPSTGIGGPRRHHQDSARGRGHEPDLPGLGGDARIIAGRAEVMAVHHAYRADAEHLRLLDGELHGHDGGGVAEPVRAVHQAGRGEVAHHARLAGDAELAELQHLLVAHQHRDAVAVHAHQVGLDHDLGGGLGIVLRTAPGRQDGQDLGPYGLVRAFIVSLNPRSRR
jgi:hypothetical protein